jgi:hypothetical protein
MVMIGDYKRRDLKHFLARMGIKSAMPPVISKPLIFESLEATLRSVTFDMSKLVLWPSIDLDAE